MLSLTKYRVWNLLKEQFTLSGDSDLKISFTFALGFFTSALPFWGFQTIIALTLAFIFRLNKIVIISISNISQPPVTPIIIYLSYLLGELLFEIRGVSVYKYFVGSIMLSLILAAVSGIVVYLLFHFRMRRQSCVCIKNFNG